MAQTVKRLSTTWETWVQSLGREVPWRRKWQSNPVLLPRKSHGQRSLVGYSPWGCKESDTPERSSSSWQWRHQILMTRPPGDSHENSGLCLLNFTLMVEGRRTSIYCSLGVGDGRGGLACCDSWGCKESDKTERLIWSDLMVDLLHSFFEDYPYCFQYWLHHFTALTNCAWGFFFLHIL